MLCFSVSTAFRKRLTDFDTSQLFRIQGLPTIYHSLVVGKRSRECCTIPFFFCGRWCWRKCVLLNARWSPPLCVHRSFECSTDWNSRTLAAAIWTSLTGIWDAKLWVNSTRASLIVITSADDEDAKNQIGEQWVCVAKWKCRNAFLLLRPIIFDVIQDRVTDDVKSKSDDTWR